MQALHSQSVSITWSAATFIILTGEVTTLLSNLIEATLHVKSGLTGGETVKV